MRCMSLQLPDRDVFCKHNYARQTHSFYRSQRPYWWNAFLAVANTWRVSWFFLAPPVIIHFRLGFSIFFNINQACWSILGYTVLETAMESCELLVNCWGWSIIPKGKVSSRYVDPWHSRSMSHCQQVRIFSGFLKVNSLFRLGNVQWQTVTNYQAGYPKKGSVHMFNSNQQGSVNDTRGWEISPARACHLSDHPCPLGEFIGMPFFGSQGLGFFGE